LQITEEMTNEKLFQRMCTNYIKLSSILKLWFSWIY